MPTGCTLCSLASTTFTKNYQKRSETFTAEEDRKFLNLAINYYRVEDRLDSAKNAREKVLALAKRREAKGEDEIAAEHYAMNRRLYLANRCS